MSGTYYLVSRKPPSFPRRDVTSIASYEDCGRAMLLARSVSARRTGGSVSVYAVEGSSRLVRGATFVRGQLVAIGQEVPGHYSWDWSY